MIVVITMSDSESVNIITFKTITHITLKYHLIQIVICISWNYKLTLIMHKISKGIFAHTHTHIYIIHNRKSFSSSSKAKNKPFTMCAMFLFNLIGIPYIRIYERNTYTLLSIVNIIYGKYNVWFCFSDFLLLGFIAKYFVVCVVHIIL